MRALLSVYDKSGLVELATSIHHLGFTLVSTGGTAETLRQADIPVTTVEDTTGFPEILDGRVKTLHPHIHAGLLARRDLDEHQATLRDHDIEPFDLVVSNLYPFEQVVIRPDSSDDERIELIDIGGPAMVRAAAKNHEFVIVLTDPSDYAGVIQEIRDDTVSPALRRRLAAKAFGHVSTYDALVAEFLRGADCGFPEELSIGLRLHATPQYGENSHQKAGAYVRLRAGSPEHGVLNAKLLKGDVLSFNNYLDADAAWQASQQFSGPTVSIVKHTVPCGLAMRDSLAKAYQAALEGDRMSAFGGIVALNQPVDSETARLMRKIKLDVIIAPAYDDDALEILSRKKGTRLLALPASDQPRKPDLDVRPIVGGMLVQESDVVTEHFDGWNQVSQRPASPEEQRDLEFAWRIIPIIKSNAIVFVKNQAIVGLGAGQPNRLESVNLASRKAGEQSHGAVMASDAYFPFADGVELANQAGVTAIVQPGGSMRDEEVIQAADAAGAAMYFTGKRHFRH